MKKALLVVVLLFLITLPASAQEYWNIKTAFEGTAVFPADTNGMAYGGAIVVTFGVPKGSFDLGFETAKWWRSFDLFSALADSLLNVPNGLDGDLYDSQLKHEQEGLKFSVLGRYKFYNLLNLDLYSGVGGGFYFLTEKREEARQSPLTGLWTIEKVDNYLQTKAQSFVLLGFNGEVFNKINLYLENRFTYIFDWDEWDDPYAYSLSLGLKYEF
jgi:hypothetical protein